MWVLLPNNILSHLAKLQNANPAYLWVEHSILFCNVFSPILAVSQSIILQVYLYRGADKSLARPGRKQATATKSLKNNSEGCPSNRVSEKWRPFNCFFSRVRLGTYQHPCTAYDEPYNLFMLHPCTAYDEPYNLFMFSVNI